MAQASDCRISIQRGRDVKIHSDVENKAVILWANDGIAVLGYTGNAYISGIPTDEWIVSHVTGVDMRGCVIYLVPGYIHKRNFGSIFHLLQSKINEISKMDPNFHLEIMVSGFKRRRRYIGSFSTTLGVAYGRTLDHSPTRPPRTPHEGRGLHINLVGDPPTSEYITTKLKTMLPSPPQSAAELASVMRSIVEDRSQHSLGVGQNAMSIFIDARTRTICHESSLVGADIPENPPRSPWICGRTMISAPSEYNGLSHTVDGWKISAVHATNSSGELSIKAADRKPVPR